MYRRAQKPPRLSASGIRIKIKKNTYRVFFKLLCLSVQEQELYQKEGLGVNEVHYVDNQDCIGR